MSVRVLLAFGTIGILLGVATVFHVYRTMAAFNAELMQRADATRDQPLLEAIADNSRTMIVILAMIVLVAALNIAAGFVMLRRKPE